MELLIINESSHRVPRKFISQWIQNLEQNLLKKRILKKSQTALELTLVFLDTKAAKELNQQFRGKAYATDVLSFDPSEPGALGELVMCPEVLVKQAQEHGLSYQHELGYMLIHGILHLLGYDHETNEQDAAEMFGIQDPLFEKLLNKI